MEEKNRKRRKVNRELRGGGPIRTRKSLHVQRYSTRSSTRSSCPSGIFICDPPSPFIPTHSGSSASEAKRGIWHSWAFVFSCCVNIPPFSFSIVSIFLAVCSIYLFGTDGGFWCRIPGGSVGHWLALGFGFFKTAHTHYIGLDWNWSTGHGFGPDWTIAATGDTPTRT